MEEEMTADNEEIITPKESDPQPEKKPKKQKGEKQKEKKDPPLLKEEVTIKLHLHPRKIIKWSIISLVIILAFFLGRLSVENGEQPSPSLEISDNESGFFNSLSNFFSHLFSSSAEDNLTAVSENGTTIPQNETLPETEEAEISPPDNNNSAENNITPSTEEQTSKEEKTIITEYNAVKLTLKDVKIDWKTTWGKVTQLQYTIENDEKGIIKPDYFLMAMEGYGDYEKKIPLPFSSKKIPAYSSASSTATIPDGFSYNELTTGELTNVKIILSLYDINDTLMSSYEKEFNLQPK